MSSDPTNEPYQISVAPEAVEVGEDHLVFPGGVLLPLSARGSGVPGMPDRRVFYTNLSTIDALALGARYSRLFLEEFKI